MVIRRTESDGKACHMTTEYHEDERLVKGCCHTVATGWVGCEKTARLTNDRGVNGGVNFKQYVLSTHE